MMQPNDYLTKATALVKQAQAAEQRGSLEEAHCLYLKSLNLFNTILHTKTCLYLSNVITPYAADCLEKLRELDLLISEPSSQKMPYTANTAPTRHGTAALMRDEPSQVSEEKDRMMQELSLTRIDPSQCTITWKEIIGSEGVKRKLDEIIRLPRELPHLYTGNRKAARSVLLYGPPGTGKTLMGKAMAHEAGVSFYSVSSADLISKWVGESEKYIKCMFEMLKANKPCILFLDEVEALCSKREENGRGANTVQQFLTQLDGITTSGSIEGVLLLACSNIPWSLDEAMRRRFEYRIYLGLPSPKEREALLRYYIGKNKHSLCDKDFHELTKLCKFFSCDDVRQLCSEASMMPINDITQATHFEMLGDGKLLVQDASHQLAMPMTYAQIRDKGSIVEQAITYTHMLKALEHTKSTVDVKKLEDYDKWTTQYGTVYL